MTAVLSPSSSPSPSAHRTQSPPANPNLSALPPLITNPSSKRSNPQRPPSYAKSRMSSYSAASNASQNRSRPPSHVFPVFHSSLPYATVRDFAYPTLHPLHYGPPAEPSGPTSGLSTPVSEQRRLSDPPPTSWDTSGGQWSAGPWGGDGFFGTHQLPQMAYGDGPPYSEDEDLHSPVVVSSKHKKSKSAWGHFGNGRGRGRSPARGRTQGEPDVTVSANHEGDRGFFTGTNGDGSETYYVNNADETANGPGGELVTYPPDQARHSTLAPNTYNVPGQRDSHFAATLPNRSYRQRDTPEALDPDDHLQNSDDDDDSEVDYRDDQSRYSRDYQFTIASPDEEMHGKAVALFDFARENENELPLVEGQVIWVSYRHGQGWLVAEDPKTGESGLVPEEYVRLLRHIEGGWTSLNGELANSTETGFLSSMSAAPDSAITPTQADSQRPNTLGEHSSHSSNGSNVGGEKHPPMVSTFSTSSKDLHPYPQHLLGTQAGQTPPHVMHYDGKKHGSQMSTPTLANPSGGFRRESGDSGGSRKHSTEEAGKAEDDKTAR